MITTYVGLIGFVKGIAGIVNAPWTSMPSVTWGGGGALGMQWVLSLPGAQVVSGAVEAGGAVSGAVSAAFMAVGAGQGSSLGGGGRGFSPGEFTHIERIRAVDVEKYISKHPLALSEPPNGPHVFETRLLISRLKNSVRLLEKIKPYLNPSSASEAAKAIGEGSAKIRRLESWLNLNPNLP